MHIAIVWNQYQISMEGRMNQKKLMFAVRIAVIAAFALCTTATQAQADENFSGRVYDIDYLGRQGWTQVLFQAVPGDSNTNLAAITKSDQLQRILETALLNSREVGVAYLKGQPLEIQMVVLYAGVDCSDKGCVQKVRCGVAVGTCLATIVGENAEVHIKDARALGILLTSMAKKKAVEYLEVDDQDFIVRVKINVP